ncbi:MAG: right-handed parallel beta-helix repeat-containing protein, partial [Candidatus Latescibacteria bacterium]|nr:right-handed parallel beta-helix repeat-containing protein [Candidatus Latescibacterota bacterium]
KILETDLKAQEITNYGEVNPAGGHRIELFFQRKFMTIARYPDEEWLKIAGVPQSGKKMINRGLDRDKSPVPRGRHYGRFTYSGSRPERWKESDDIWVHGYWTWDWSDQYLKVKNIDKDKRDIYPAEPHHGYGYTKNQRYYFLNIMEELDAPGEWYIDRTKGVLYFWPPSPINEGDAVVSILEDTMLSLEETSHITIRGIIFECSRGGAVHITGGAHNKIAGCTFRNLGQTVVKIDSGTENGITSSDIYDIAAGGVILNGGDHKTLTPAGNYAVNNHIHDFGKRIKTYTPSVQVTGVGNHVAHNLIHDAPHTGIFLVTGRVGNDHIIEYNELHSLAKETGDVGAIYLCARDFTFRGTVIRHNYLHHLLGPGLHGVMGVYLDDFTSGTTIYGNVFYRAGRASFIGGGRNNTIENNIYIECEPSVHLDARGLGWAKNYFENNNRFVDLMNAVNYREPPYSEKYPELLTLQDDDPAVPKYNRILGNVSYGGRWFDLYNGLDFSIFTMKDNLIADPDLCRWLKKGQKDFITYKSGDQEIIDELKENRIIETDPGFVDLENENFQLRDDSPAYALGFKKIPIEKIGLYIDEYRKSLP